MFLSNDVDLRDGSFFHVTIRRVHIRGNDLFPLLRLLTLRRLIVVIVARVLDDPRVVAATLTGSEPAGSRVAEQAGKRIKKAVLELGGSDPFIVMPSAGFEAAVNTAVKARTINNGQSCIAAKRFIVHEEIYDRFESEFVAAMKRLRVGDPVVESTDIGPLATEQILKDLEEQVKVSVAAGAKILTGGQRVQFEDELSRGNFYEPTVLADIPKDTPAYRDELFGPVASLFSVVARSRAWSRSLSGSGLAAPPLQRTVPPSLTNSVSVGPTPFRVRRNRSPACTLRQPPMRR